MAERLYSVQQTAELLGTSAAEVRGWIDLGHLPAERPAGDLRISERGLVRFLTACGVDLEEVLTAAMTGEGGPAAPQEPSAGPAPRAPAASADRPPEDAEAADRAASGRGDAAARLAEAILRDALARGAEAVFLEPVPGSLTLRLRVGGRLREKPRFASRLPRGLGPLLMARFRATVGLARAAGRDAVVTVPLDGRPRRFRLAARPTPHGEGLAIYPVG